MQIVSFGENKWIAAYRNLNDLVFKFKLTGGRMIFQSNLKKKLLRADCIALKKPVLLNNPSWDFPSATSVLPWILNER